ncbi:uncharacterized protein LOC144151693 [Haemaphysalis longicornis]
MEVRKGRVIVAFVFIAALCSHKAASNNQPNLQKGSRFFAKLLHAVVVWKKLDPMKLPDQYPTTFPPGKMHLFDGVLMGLSTVYQTGPVFFSAVNEGVAVNLNLGLGRTEAEYKIRLSGPVLSRHLIQLRAFFPGAKIWLELKEDVRAKLTLRNFRMSFPRGIEVHLRAVNPKDKFLDSILKTLMEFLKPQMPELAEKLLRTEVKKALEKLNRFVETGSF